MKNLMKFACGAVCLFWASTLIPTFADATATAPATAPATPSAAEETVGPAYANAPEATAKDGVPVGDIKEFVMNSEDSKIYPGLKGPYKRKVAVYIPKQYVAGTAAPFIVIQDGLGDAFGYYALMPKILDNMINDHRLPVMIAIFIDSGGGNGQGSERGLEYDTLSERYATFIQNEVLPKISKDYNVTFTTDPEGRASMGGSSGAACAFTMAWFRPDLFRRVLSYSGTFVNQQSPVNPESPHGAWEYHEHLIPNTDAKPIRIWFEVGEKDVGNNRSEESMHNWVLANQHMLTVLKAKGYQYHFVFAKDAGHIDKRMTGQTLADAMLWLWQGYPAK